jgi:large subunit ribosomal protein L2
MAYVLATEGLRVGDYIFSKESVVCKTGNSAYLSNLPIGLKISSIELIPNNGAQFIRAAGSYATIVSKFEKTIILKLKSGELRKIPFNCLATVGAVSNFQYIYRNFRKAGFYRLKG